MQPLLLEQGLAVTFTERPLLVVRLTNSDAQHSISVANAPVQRSTGLGGAVVKPSDLTLVGTGFATQYQLPHRAVF